LLIVVLRPFRGVGFDVVSYELFPPPVAGAGPAVQAPRYFGELVLQLLDTGFQGLDHFSLPRITALIRPVDEPHNAATEDAEETPEGAEPLKIHIGVLRLAGG
jgi:hypothetical protein